MQCWGGAGQGFDTGHNHILFPFSRVMLERGRSGVQSWAQSHSFSLFPCNVGAGLGSGVQSWAQSRSFSLFPCNVGAGQVRGSIRSAAALFFCVAVPCWHSRGQEFNPGSDRTLLRRGRAMLALDRVRGSIRAARPLFFPPLLQGDGEE